MCNMQYVCDLYVQYAIYNIYVICMCNMLLTVLTYLSFHCRIFGAVDLELASLSLRVGRSAEGR